jgi:hypothetical protein
MITRRQLDVNARDTYVITSIQSAAVTDRVVGICPVRSQLIKVYETHGTASDATQTLSIERLQGTETSGNGDAVVNATIDLEGTANTVQEGTVVTTSDIHIFEAGDRVGTNVSASGTAVASMIVTLQFRPVDD